MKQLGKIVSTSCLLTVAALSTGAQATIISSSDVAAIHSATFDGPPAAAPPGQFIPNPTGTSVTFTNVGTANGGSTATGLGLVEYDGTTLRLASVQLPDLDVQINTAGETADVTTSGATISLTAPGIDTEAGIAGFQVEGGANIVADFSSFSDVTTNCSETSAVPTICPGIPFLNLDGVRYQIDGTITPGGGDAITLTLQTSNQSILVIDLVTAPATEEPNINYADVLAIHSATFDGPPAAAPPGQFIPDPTGTSVTFTSVGTANGGITPTGLGILEYDGTTLRLGSVLLPDLDVQINTAGETADVTTSGAVVNLTAPGTDTEAGIAGFQVEGGANVVADFSSFSDVTLSCSETSAVPTICPGIPFLNLDGVRYQIDGEVTAQGGDVVTLTLQTSNQSILVIGLTTVAPGANIPVPPFALFGIFAALAAIGFSVRKAKK